MPIIIEHGWQSGIREPHRTQQQQGLWLSAPRDTMGPEWSRTTTLYRCVEGLTRHICKLCVGYWYIDALLCSKVYWCTDTVCVIFCIKYAKYQPRSHIPQIKGHIHSPFPQVVRKVADKAKSAVPSSGEPFTQSGAPSKLIDDTASWENHNA